MRLSSPAPVWSRPAGVSWSVRPWKVSSNGLRSGVTTAAARMPMRASTGSDRVFEAGIASGERSVVPPGLGSFSALYPALKRWASLDRPSGASLICAANPRLASWAVFLRPSGAWLVFAANPRFAPWAAFLRPLGHVVSADALGVASGIFPASSGAVGQWLTFHQ